MINKNFRIDYELPMNFISQSQGGKDNIYAELQQYAREELNVNDASFLNLKDLYGLLQEIYTKNYT